MKSFGRYFAYHFRSTLLRLAVLAVLALVLTFFFATFFHSEGVRYPVPSYSDDGKLIYEDYVTVSSFSGDVSVLVYIAIAISCVMPVLELAPFQNRRNTDTLLMLPVGREKMALVHYLNGLLQILSVNLACFLLTLLRMVLYTVYDPMRLCLFALLIMLGSWIVYSVFSFVFAQANTVADGIVFMVVWTGLLALLVGAFQSTLDLRDGDLPISWSWFFVLSPMVVALSRMNGYVVYGVVYNDSGFWRDYASPLHWESADGICMILWSVIALLCVGGLLLTFRTKRQERIGGISSSWFGYRVLIPLTCFGGVLAVGTGGLLAVLLLVVMAIGYIVYRRGFRLRIPDLVMMGVMLAAAFIL